MALFGMVWHGRGRGMAWWGYGMACHGRVMVWHCRDPYGMHTENYQNIAKIFRKLVSKYFFNF